MELKHRIVFANFLIVSIVSFGVHSLPEKCLLPKASGNSGRFCNAKLTMYYFNHKLYKCQKFIYSGCGGNDNRYFSREECEATCPLTEEEKAKQENLNKIQKTSYVDNPLLQTSAVQRIDASLANLPEEKVIATTAAATTIPQTDIKPGGRSTKRRKRRGRGRRVKARSSRAKKLRGRSRRNRPQRKHRGKSQKGRPRGRSSRYASRHGQNRGKSQRRGTRRGRHRVEAKGRRRDRAEKRPEGAAAPKGEAKPEGTSQKTEEGLKAPAVPVSEAPAANEATSPTLSKATEAAATTAAPKS